MAAIIFPVWLVHSLIQHPQVVGDELEKETHFLSVHGSMCQVPGSAEDLAAVGAGVGNPEQSGSSWGVTVWAALQQWPFWAAAAVLVLFLVLAFSSRKGAVSQKAVARRSTPAAMQMRPQMIKETMLWQRKFWR